MGNDTVGSLYYQDIKMRKNNRNKSVLSPDEWKEQNSDTINEVKSRYKQQEQE